MYAHRFLVALTATVGASLGTALAAADDTPIDTWPYINALLDGVPEGTVNPQGTTEGVTYDWTTVGPEQVPWYTADVTNSSVDNLYYSNSQDVTGILDSSFGYPSVGTVANRFETFYVPVNVYGQSEYLPMYNNYSISDPNLGTADETSMFFGGVQNLYVSDSAGIEDQITFAGGQPITLFDFPAAGADTGGAAEFGPLLTELADTMPSATDLF